MSKRFIDTDIFKKGLVKRLEAPYKLLWIYILNDCNHAGIWEVELDIAEKRLGVKFETPPAEIFKEKIIEFDKGDKWFIPSFVEFQYGDLNPQNRAHSSVIQILKKYNLIDGAYKPLTSPLQGAMDMDKDKDKDKELDKDKEKAREEKSTTPRQVFVPPSIPEVKEYISEKMGSLWTPAQVDALAFKFWEFYGKKGWKVGKTPMVNWKIACNSAIREWEIPGFTNNNKTNHNGKQNTQNDYDRFREAAREAGIADGITDNSGSQWHHPG